MVKKHWGIPVLVLGLAITFACYGNSFIKDDLGFHVHKEDILKKCKGGNK